MNEKQFVEQWYDHAMKIARACARKWPQYHMECESAALVGLLKAARTYRSDRGQTILNWVNHKVRYAIQEEVRSLDRSRAKRRVDFVPYIADDAKVTKTKGLRFDPEEYSLAHWALSQVPRNVEAIIRMRAEGVSPGDIAERLGMRVNSVHSLYSRGLSDIRKMIESKRKAKAQQNTIRVVAGA